jgi:hypothetical protein
MPGVVTGHFGRIVHLTQACFSAGVFREVDIYATPAGEPAGPSEGAGAVQVIRLGYALEDLSSADRAYCLALVRDLIEGAGA